MTTQRERLSPVLNPPDTATVYRIAEETTRDMLFALRRALSTAGLQLKQLDQRFGLGNGYYGHLLQGDLHLQISHVMLIAQSLGRSQRSLYDQVLPGLKQLTQTATAHDRPVHEPPDWWPDGVVLKEIVSEILDDQLADSLETTDSESTKATTLVNDALKTNRRVRQLLRRTIKGNTLSVSEVARRLGKGPNWLYTRFNTDSANLRFSFCIEVLLACKVQPAEFFHHVLLELEGPPPQLQASTPYRAPTRGEIRSRLEPVVAQLWAECERKGGN